MNNIQYYIIIIIVTLYCLAGCQHDSLVGDMTIDPVDSTGVGSGGGSGSGGGGGSGGGNSRACNPDTVYFVQAVLPILRSNCAIAGCHGAGSSAEGVELSNYNNIINTGEVVAFNLNESELYEVITETDMDKIMPPPPSNPLSSEQIAVIANWISQGALNNSCIACDTTTVTFSQTISPIIANNCQGCHSGGAPQGGISLTNHSQIATQANNGRLFGAINHEAGFSAMPQNQPKLDQCLIDQIMIWIDAGAKND